MLGRFSSHFSDYAKEMLSSAFPRVPSNMPRKTVAVVAMLHKTAEPIYHELQRLNQETVAETGVPMHGPGCSRGPGRNSRARNPTASDISCGIGYLGKQAA